jgi:hypothetical protein
MNGETFRAWTEQFLASVLRPGDIIIRDNLPSHKVAGTREAIELHGALLHYSRPPARTSIPSSKSLPSIRPPCEKPPHAPSQNTGAKHPKPSKPAFGASLLRRHRHVDLITCASFFAGNEHNGKVKRPIFEHIIGLFVLRIGITGSSNYTFIIQ